MTTRADLPRLGASLGLVGTLLEHQGQLAWDTMDGWQTGPRKAPEQGIRGGGAGEAGAEDRKDEAMQRIRAARRFQAFRVRLAEIDSLAQELIRDVDIACPPHPATLRNAATDNLDPITAAEAAIDGWCSSCWRNDQQHVPIEVERKTGLRYHRDLCRWCGSFKAKYKIDPPLILLKLRHAGSSITEGDITEAIKAAKPAKKGKRRKGKVAA